MFEKIVITTDLSEASNAVIGCLKDFKSLGVEEVILFYACGVRYSAPLVDEITEQVEPELMKQKKVVEDQGFNASVEIAPGMASDELKEFAGKNDVSLIVVGTHGSSASSHSLFRMGGVASEIIHGHEKPLLVVRIRVTEENGDKKVETTCHSLKDRILFVTDFSDISMNAFEYVKEMVADGCKKVTLFHVQDKVKLEKLLSDKLDEYNRIDNERLALRKKELLDKGAEDVEIKIVYGLPAREIIQESKDDYSLVVMGSQGRGFFPEIFLGSVSHNVVRNSDVSVLLVPNPDR